MIIYNEKEIVVEFTVADFYDIKTHWVRLKWKWLLVWIFCTSCFSVIQWWFLQFIFLQWNDFFLYFRYLVNTRAISTNSKYFVKHIHIKFSLLTIQLLWYVGLAPLSKIPSSATNYRCVYIFKKVVPKDFHAHRTKNNTDWVVTTLVSPDACPNACSL